MTRKDYEAIADIIRRQMKASEHSWKTDELTPAQEAIRKTAIHLAVTFGDMNPRFNREIFYKACGL
jgi:hypothetical protein